MSARRLSLMLVLAALLGVGVLLAQAQTDPTSPPPDDPTATRDAATDPTTTESTEDAAAEPVTEDEPEMRPRARYNHALELMTAGDPEAAADQFLQARDEAGPDPELRYNAAFNLGVALAGVADVKQLDAPEEAIEVLRQSSAWFNDAIRLAPEGDEDARVNLELVLRRIQQLADQLNKGNTLEARLDRVIDDQRGLRDRVRRLLQLVDAEGASADPLGFQKEFEDLATQERTLQAEAGTILDLAAEERGLVENKTEEERSDEERLRLVQLQNLEYYLQQARQSLSDSRRRLRRLEGERAHRRADAALAELKRAREQLHDPVKVMKALAQDETELLQHTRGLEVMSGGGIRLEDDRTLEPPRWLTTEHLTDRQQTIALRTDEVLARLQAGVAAGDDTENPAAEQQASPEQERMLAAAAEAIPLIEEAKAAMDGAALSIPADQLRAAAEDEARSIRALYKAIERFADVRQLIELAYSDQTQAVQLLTPPDANADERSPMASLSTEERVRLVRDAVDSNEERLDRLEQMLVDERAEAEAQASQAAQAAPGGPPAPGAAATPDQASEQLEQIGQKYDLAEQLRAQAAGHLAELSNALAIVEGGKQTTGLLPPAESTRSDLEELRRLFFNLVEHLKELLQNQMETHDKTATLQFEADTEGLDLGLAPTAQRQNEHAEIATILAQAVDRQADSAAAGGDPQAAEQLEALTEAAAEVHGAAARMEDAGGQLGEARDEFATVSTPDLEPVLEHQLQAIEHLENAIRLLEPPQNQDGDDQQQQQQQQQQQNEMSQRQAQRRLQAIRDREAERQRRREQEAQQTEPVEKDW